MSEQTREIQHHRREVEKYLGMAKGAQVLSADACAAIAVAHAALAVLAVVTPSAPKDGE